MGVLVLKKRYFLRLKQMLLANDFFKLVVRRIYFYEFSTIRFVYKNRINFAVNRVRIRGNKEFVIGFKRKTIVFLLRIVDSFSCYGFLGTAIFFISSTIMLESGRGAAIDSTPAYFRYF